MSSLDRFRSTAGGVRRPKWQSLTVAAFAAAGALGVVLAALAGGLSPSLMLAPYFGLIGWLGLRHAFESTAGATYSEDTLVVGEDQTLRAGSRVLAERRDLKQGFVVPSHGITLVRLERRGLRPPLLLWVKDEAEGEALLGALGLGADRVAARMTIASGLLAIPRRKLTLLLGLPLAFGVTALLSLARFWPGVPSSIALVFAGVFAAIVLPLFAAPMSVCVGTDGVLTRWLGRERFLPADEIRSVTVYEGSATTQYGEEKQYGVAVGLARGEEVRLPTGSGERGSLDAQRLAHRIATARVAPAAEGAVAASALHRGERPLAAWIRDLRRLGGGAHDLRSPAIPVETLLRIVEDTHAPAIDRAAAAVAATASAEADAKTRVRIAAEASASPKLRVSLERIADTSAEDDGESLAPCLEELAASRSS